MYERRIQNGQHKHPLTLALKEWMDGLRGGRRLSDSVKDWVYSDEKMLIAAGEQSGSLYRTLESVAEIMEAKKKIKGAVIAGVTYPIMMLMLAFSVLIMFSFKIIPTFATIVKNDQWHGIARIMIDFADFSRDWLWLIISIILVTLIAFAVSLPRWTKGLRIKFDKYLPYSMYRLVQGASWIISFSALIAAGVRVENALQYTEAEASPWLRVRISACLAGMRSGLNVGDSLLRSGYGFPDIEIIDDFAVYSKLSGFDTAAAIIGREWITESVERIQKIMRTVFGISVLLVGGFVAFMVSGLITMELQMSEIMRQTYR